MITKDLFNSVLIQPVVNGADELFIVSGYASSAMAFHHINAINNNYHNVKVHLIVGMTVNDGMSLSNHRGFQKLMTDDFKDNFECSYIIKSPPIHSKIYSWFSKGKPRISFAGSANYSQKAFYNRQREIMMECDNSDAILYFNSVVSDSIYCNHQEAENLVTIYNERYYPRIHHEYLDEDQNLDNIENISGLEHVNLSLINRYGEISARSGLNWGQRPEYGREPNQAYIPLKAGIYNTSFFPERGSHFTIYTDDGKILICVRAQEYGKAIETPHNNSLIGEYFRYRLGLQNGELILMEHLTNYGRTDIDFYKIDEETYYMDFSN